MAEVPNRNAKPPARGGRSTSRRAFRGQSVLELSLIVPLCLVLLAGLVDFGHAIQSDVAITNALNEGGRYASRDPTNDTAIRAHIDNELTGTGITITAFSVTYPSGANTSGSPVKVQVSCRVPTILVGFIGLNSITVTKSIQMVIL